MVIEWIHLENFRNFRDLRVAFDAGVNVIRGRNGQGKTSLLEAVCMLSLTKSMRGARDRDCIRFDQPWAKITGAVSEGADAVSEGADEHQTQTQTLTLTLSPEGKKTLTRDGAAEHTAREWLELACLPVVFFGPAELELVRAGPARRRRLLDTALCQISPGYLRALALYKKAHEHKKSILAKHFEKPSLVQALPEFDARLARYGGVVMAERAAYVRDMAALAAAYYERISRGAEALAAAYSPSVTDSLQDAFQRAREHDLRTGKTRTGILYDDVALALDGRDARLYASQGQARTVALALKLAERDMLRAALGSQPALLLDDVMSELDGTRRSFLLDGADDGQTLITDCAGLDGIKKGKTIHIEDGRVANETQGFNQEA